MTEGEEKLVFFMTVMAGKQRRVEEGTDMFFSPTHDAQWAHNSCQWGVGTKTTF